MLQGLNYYFSIAQGNEYRVTCLVTNIKCVLCELLHYMFHPFVRVASPSLRMGLAICFPTLNRAGSAAKKKIINLKKVGGIDNFRATECQ